MSPLLEKATTESVKSHRRNKVVFFGTPIKARAPYIVGLAAGVYYLSANSSEVRLTACELGLSQEVIEDAKVKFATFRDDWLDPRMDVYDQL